MGNQNGVGIDPFSRFKGGYLYVKTDKPYYYPGNVVLGKIYIRAENEMAPASLMIKVRGTESSSYRKRITTTTGEGAEKKSKSEMIKIGYWKDLINYDGCCFTFNGPLMPGDYTIPFEFTLPEYAPASIIW